MREFDALKGYPPAKEQRVVGPNIRTIASRIVASYRDERYYDGDRKDGYGGFNYDGRWVPIARTIYKKYGLKEDSAILHVGCEKGFLLHDFNVLFPKMKLRGTEVSEYAIKSSMHSIRDLVCKTPFTQLPFKDNEFDFVIAIGVVYTLNLADAIKCLKEIQRVGKGKSFVTLAAYSTEEDFWLFNYWTLLGCTILREDEWVEVLKHVGYTGDYKFTTAMSLKLVRENQP